MDLNVDLPAELIFDVAHYLMKKEKKKSEETVSQLRNGVNLTPNAQRNDLFPVGMKRVISSKVGPTRLLLLRSPP